MPATMAHKDLTVFHLVHAVLMLVATACHNVQVVPEKEWDHAREVKQYIPQSSEVVVSMENQIFLLCIASFPGTHVAFGCTTKSWAGPENEPTYCVLKHYNLESIFSKF